MVWWLLSLVFGFFGFVGAQSAGAQHGQMVVQADKAAVMPIGVALTGPLSREVFFTDTPAVRVDDLPAGDYQVHALFQGTVQGSPIALRVEPGRATEVRLPVSDVGGFRFLADSGMCEMSDTWQFVSAAVVVDARSAGLEQRPVPGLSKPASPTCLREVAGLSPGRYQIRVVPPTTLLPPYVVVVNVIRQAWTEVPLTWPAVIVRGRVMAGGAAVRDTVVQFTANAPVSALGGTRFEAARVAEDGTYVAALRAPGRYRPEVTIDLVSRTGWLDVVTADGQPARGAYFYTVPSAVNSTTSDEGRINLATIAPGTALSIRTLHWGVTCHQVTEAPLQRVAVPEATGKLVFVVPDPVPDPTKDPGAARTFRPAPTARLIGAQIAGIPGSTCALEYDDLLKERSHGPDGAEIAVTLPHGTYTLMLADGSTHTVQAPGRAVVK